MPLLPLDKKMWTTTERPDGVGVTFLRNVIRNDAGHLVTRPGLTKTLNIDPAGSTTGVVYKIVHMRNNNRIIAFCEKTVIEVNVSNWFFVSLTAFPAGVGTYTANAVSAVESSDKLYFAAGLKMCEWDIATGLTIMADPQAPVQVTHLVDHNSRLMAISADKMYWSDVGAPTAWSGDYVSAELEGDKLLGMWSNKEEIMLCGAETIEFWYDAGGNPTFARYPNAISEFGIGSKNAVVEYSNGYFIVDNHYNVRWLQGRQSKIISDPIRGLMLDSWLGEDYSVWGGSTSNFSALEIIRIEKSDYLLVFCDDLVTATAKNTFAYDIKKDEWFIWSTQTSLSGADVSYGGIPGISNETRLIAEAKNTAGTAVLGAGRDSWLARPDETYAQDYLFGIEVEIKTGWIDWGSTEWKRCRELRLTLGSNGVTKTAKTNLNVYYRNDGSSTWIGPRAVDFMSYNDGTYTARLRGLGRYRRRQWKFTVPAGSVSDISQGRLYLMSAEEIVGK